METYRGDVQVECRAGLRGEEEPCRFRYGTRQVDVVEILDRWPDPDHRTFKVRGADRNAYMLRHDVRSGKWSLHFFPPAAR